jgi:hypothetical protein
MKKEIIREKTVPFSIKQVQFFFQIVKYKGYTRKTLVEEKTSSYFKENTYARLEWPVQILKTRLEWPVQILKTRLEWAVQILKTRLEWAVQKLKTRLEWPVQTL